MKRTIQEIQQLMDGVGEVDERHINKQTRRQRISEAKSGVSLGPHSAEHRARIAAANQIALNRPEVRKKLSDLKSGKRMSDESKAKLRERVFSDETREKMSATAKARKGRVSPNKGKSLSVEQRVKLSNALQGRVFSDETRAKLSLKLKEAWRRKREPPNNDEPPQS